MALAHRDLAGIHFTGSTPTFQHLWRTVGDNIAGYRSYPRIVGETGGKDFVVAHPTADPDVLRIGAGARRVRVPGPEVLGRLPRVRAAVGLGPDARRLRRPRSTSLTMGDVTDFSNFMGAVIDDRAFAKHKEAIERAKRDSTVEVVAGGQVDDSVGYFVRPTVVESTDPTNQIFTDRVLRPDPRGPRLRRRRLRPDARRRWSRVAPYALTGAIIAQDRRRHRRRHVVTCASRPATSTSTTSRPVPSSASSRSAARAPPAPTTRPAPRRT